MTQIAYPGGGPVYGMTFDVDGTVGGMNDVREAGIRMWRRRVMGWRGRLSALSYFGYRNRERTTACSR